MSLYPPPPELATELFTAVPERFRRTGEAAAWVEANRPGERLGSFLEGPSFDREGRLYVTDIPYGRIFRISAAGDWVLIADYDGWPNGLKIHKDGRVFIADHRLGIMELAPDSGAVTPVLTHRRSESFKGVNDLVFDRRGRLYFTDQGQTGLQDPSGRVFRFDLESRRLDCLIDRCPSPNGLVLSPDERVLFVAMTRGNAVWRLPLAPDGGVTKVGIFVQLAGGIAGADGLAIDQEGSLAVCDVGNGCVWIFSKWGEPLFRIRACSSGRATTNLAYGGPENRQLFVIESETGSILKARLKVPGQPMFSHQD